MRKSVLIPAIGLLVVCLSSAFWLVSAADPTETVRLSADVTLHKDSDFLTGFIPARTTIADVFDHHMVQSADTPVLISAIASAIDVRRLRAGQPYSIDRLLDGRVRRFEYEIDGDKRLLIERAQLEGAPRFLATVERIPKHTTVVTIEGNINRETNSLTAAIDKAGERIELALGMADVFSGEIDFNSDLQPGDRFRVLVERQTREGKLSGYGAILAAEFLNDNRTLKAIRFTPDGGSPAYYDENGRSLKRFFLKSPLKFEPRITSSFSSSRKHPILGYSRAHNGVDYHAPSGAPVAAVAPGA
jgi:murein DD-endopeptidase MepM/ murein hydrolase activator NlpD